MGHTVYILAPSFPGYKDHDKTIIRYPSLPNPIIKTYPIGIPLISTRKIKKINPDVVHTHHALIFGQFGKQISEKLSIPLFFSAHTHYEHYIDFYFPFAKRLTKKIYDLDMKDLARKCYKVICPSYQTEERLKSSFGINNTVVINNSIDDAFFTQPRKKSLAHPTLIFTGRLEKEKNLFFLLKIANELKKLIPGFRMLIIGTGSQADSLHDKIHKYHLEENILLAGELHRNLLPEIYKSAHLFITPSLSEVMPLTVIEALACGLPTIALERSKLEDIVIDGKSGYLLKPNLKVIAKKISEIFSNEKLYARLSKNAYEHALNFSITQKAKELENLYKEAMTFSPR